MKLYDFECGTCGTKFERMVESDVTALECKKAPVCHGNAARLLGGHPAVVSSQRREYRGPPLPVRLRHVADTGDGNIFEAAGPSAAINALEPGMEVKIAVHDHNEDGSCSDRTIVGTATILGERGEDA